VASASLGKHLLQQHGTQLRPMELAKSKQGSREKQNYQIGVPLYCQSIVCPVLDCPGTTTCRLNLRRHFMFKHPDDEIVILEEGILPRCDQCDMFVPSGALGAHINEHMCAYKALS
jgi:hypothetical protein